MSSDYIATISIGKKNTRVSVEDYKGVINIVSTWEGREGKIMENWVFRQEKVNGENVPGKAHPLKIKIGDNKDEAIAILTQLIVALGEKPPF